MYFIVVAAFFWVELPYWQHRGFGVGMSTHDQIWYWSFLSNWHDAAGHMVDGIGVLWSLGIEEQFYLIWPLIIFLCAARYFPAVCVFISAFSLVLRIVLSTGHFIDPALLSEWLHRATITRLDTLAIGALIAVLIRRPDWAQCARAWVKVVAPACFTIATMMWFNAWGLAETLGYTVIATGFACVVLVCVMDEGSNHPLCRFARIGVLQSIGRYSYGIYVLHLLVMRYLKSFGFNHILPSIEPSLLQRTPVLIVSLIAMVACLAASYLAAIVSWNLVEKRFLRLKDHFAYRFPAPKVIAASTIV